MSRRSRVRSGCAGCVLVAASLGFSACGVSVSGTGPDDAGMPGRPGPGASVEAGVEGGSASSGSSGSSSSSGGASSSSSGGSSSGGAGGLSPTVLPTISGTCPTLANGTITVTAGGGTIQAQIFAVAGAPAGGPLIVYWHATGSNPNDEVPLAFDVPAVTAAGGLIAAFVSNSRTGPTMGDTGNGVWFESDVAFADQVVACAISQLQVDPRRIHVAGYSAGALQTVYMWFARSGYVASVISYSGGTDGENQVPLQDPTNVPPLIAAHGAMGQDVFVLDFAQTSAQWEGISKQAGGFSIDCNDGGNHLSFFTTRAPNLKPVSFQFFLDHPFKVSPEPYAALPSTFPSYCTID
jgi:predicted esterase